jgi:hypothetical protein
VILLKHGMDAGDPGVMQSIPWDHWARVESMLTERLPEPVASALRDGMPKVPRCRTEVRRFARYRYADCDAAHTVCFTCKSRLGPACHKHRPLKRLRRLLYGQRELLGVVAKAATQATPPAVGTRCRAQARVPGVMTMVYIFDRDLSWHVHVHVLCTEGD